MLSPTFPDDTAHPQVAQSLLHCVATFFYFLTMYELNERYINSACTFTCKAKQCKAQVCIVGHKQLQGKFVICNIGPHK